MAVLSPQLWIHDVGPQKPGRRLDVTLAQAAKSHAEARVRALSREQIKALIARGQVRSCAPGASVCRRIEPAARMQPGERIEVTLLPPEPAQLIAQAMSLDILFEDEHLVVLNKAAHLPVHPGAGVRRATLVEGLLAHCGDLSGIGGVLRPGVVHRLDADTTGAIVFAKHDVVHRALTAQFAARQVHKRYVALVAHAPVPAGQGLISEPEAGGWQRIATPIARHPTDRKRFCARRASGPRARQAITRLRIVGYDDEVLLADIALETGRTHQIRVHLAEGIGPVVCDHLYRPNVAHRPQNGRHRAALSSLTHHALHAYALQITHPVTQRALRCVAPIPPSWRALAQRLAPQACDPALAASLGRATLQPDGARG